jgi:hypothetical protein
MCMGAAGQAFKCMSSSGLEVLMHTKLRLVQF